MCSSDLERPIAGPASRQMASRVRVGVRETGQHDASGSVDPSCIGRGSEVRADPDDPVLLDEDVSPYEGRRMTHQDLTASDNK